jgi:pyruvate/2-oxoacid:ferredoxin oxidoreductase beta subunit
VPLELDELIARGIAHRGFSFLEIVSDCPEYFGRYNKLGRGPEMLQLQRRRFDEVDLTLRAKRFVGEAHATDMHALRTGVLHEVER